MSARTKVRFLLVLAAIAAVLSLHAGAQQVATSPAQAQAQSQALALTQAMPVDPQITTGRFSNGLRYYLRTNKLPEKRAELRLAVNAGSVLEDDDQLGLAHMLEHMAFNGTAHFPKQEIVSFMESIGMRFGPSLNAFTSFDETVYMLTVPTDKPEIMEKALPDPGGLGPQSVVRPGRNRQGARRHRRGMAAGPRGRRPDAGCPVPRPVQGIALRRTPAHREEGDNRHLQARHAEAVLPGLVPAGPDGHRGRRRFRQGRRRGTPQEALRVAARRQGPPAAADLQRARQPGHALHRRRRQGSNDDAGVGVQQAAAGRAGNGRRLPAADRRATGGEHAEPPPVRHDAETRLAVRDGGGRPIDTRPIQGSGNPQRDPQGRRHRPRAGRGADGGREGGEIRVHRDRTRPPEARDAQDLRAALHRAGEAGICEAGERAGPQFHAEGDAAGRRPGVRAPPAVPPGDRARRGQQDRRQLDGRPEPGRDGVRAAEARPGRARRGDARGGRQGHRGEADHGVRRHGRDDDAPREDPGAGRGGQNRAPGGGRRHRVGTCQRRESGAQADRLQAGRDRVPRVQSRRHVARVRRGLCPRQHRGAGDVDHGPREVQHDRSAQGHGRQDRLGAGRDRRDGGGLDGERFSEGS